MQETQIQPVGQEDLIAKEMAICSSNSCLENSMGQVAWQATVQGITKSWTQLSMHRCTHISFQKSRSLYTTAHSSFLFEYLIRISKLFCTKLSLNILPPNNYFFLIAPQLIKCQLQFFQLLSQKPYNHPWLHSFSHTQHVIHQQILLALSSKYILKLTTFHHLHLLILKQSLSCLTWIIAVIF